MLSNTPLVLWAFFIVLTGMLIWTRRRRQIRREVEREAVAHAQRENAIRCLRLHELKGDRVTPVLLAHDLHTSAEHASEILHDMHGRGLVRVASEEIHLTSEGRSIAEPRLP